MKRKTKYPTRSVLKLTEDQKKVFHEEKYYLEVRKQLDKIIKKKLKENK